MAGRQTGGRARALIFLTFSIVAGLFAVLIIWQMIQKYEEEVAAVQTVEETVQVVVAAHDMAQGHQITETDLVAKDLPLNYVPNSVLRDAGEAIGRTPRERILADEFIRQERLADPEAGVGLNAIIPRGMRALAVNIEGGGAVSGFLNPGNYVDVIVTVEADGEIEAETNTILQAVPVLAVNTRMGVGSETGASNNKKGQKVRPMVTLAVTPDQAEELTHAMAEGSVTLTLRNDIDVTEVESHGARVSELLGDESGEDRVSVTEWRKATGDQPKDGSLIVIRGSDETVEKVKN